MNVALIFTALEIYLQLLLFAFDALQLILQPCLIFFSHMSFACNEICIFKLHDYCISQIKPIYNLVTLL